MVVSLVKTAEPIEMPFGLWGRMDPRNHVLGGVQTPWEGIILREERVAHCEVYGRSAMSWAKTAYLTEIPFGTRLGQGKPVLGGVYIGATWRRA